MFEYRPINAPAIEIPVEAVPERPRVRRNIIQDRMPLVLEFLIMGEWLDIHAAMALDAAMSDKTLRPHMLYLLHRAPSRKELRCRQLGSKEVTWLGLRENCVQNLICKKDIRMGAIKTLLRQCR